MTRYNHKEKIRDHYDRVSPYYHSLWGEHLHHGYWIRGDETKEQAQVQLIEHLARAAGIAPGRRILDVGCGFGASSIYLARNYNAEATGIKISPDGRPGDEHRSILRRCLVRRIDIPLSK